MLRKLLMFALISISSITMAASNAPLKEYDTGHYSELARRPNPQHFVILYIPSLAAVLLAKERKKGSPLTKQEVESIRDKSMAMVGVPDRVQAVVEGRGYEDVDPPQVWEEWQILRMQLE